MIKAFLKDVKGSRTSKSLLGTIAALVAWILATQVMGWSVPNPFSAEDSAPAAEAGVAIVDAGQE